METINILDYPISCLKFRDFPGAKIISIEENKQDCSKFWAIEVTYAYYFVTLKHHTYVSIDGKQAYDDENGADIILSEEAYAKYLCDLEIEKLLV